MDILVAVAAVLIVAAWTRRRQYKVYTDVHWTCGSKLAEKISMLLLYHDI
jgi:hypothetical protein